jgi:hypothetical protein
VLLLVEFCERADIPDIKIPLPRFVRFFVYDLVAALP